MTTKEYLSQIRTNEIVITNKTNELRQLKEMAQSVQGFNGEGERVQSNGDKDKLGKTVARFVDLEREIDEEIYNLLTTRAKIIKQIEEIDCLEFYNILHRHYISCKSLEEIAFEMSYSYRHITRIHADALCAFEAKHGAEYKDL